MKAITLNEFIHLHILSRSISVNAFRCNIESNLHTFGFSSDFQILTRNFEMIYVYIYIEMTDNFLLDVVYTYNFYTSKADKTSYSYARSV